MPPVKRSGHARLQSALVLRDALAAELGLALPSAMAQLRTVEDTIGAKHGLTEGRYLEALGSVCKRDTAHLSILDDEVRQACGRVQFAPRYAQYLALVLFAHWMDAQREDASAFLIRLNTFLAQRNPDAETVTEFVDADLQWAAFWMATAAGKTHLLHACMALLERRRSWDRRIVVTPSESLTRQHAERLRALTTWEVFAYPMDGDASSIGRLPSDTVIVLDINKLANEKKGDGVTVPTSVFADGSNLVFVDEGHKGQKSESSIWKALQANLAGVGARHAPHRGMLIEFSATFGQVAEAEHAFDRYAKSVVFDYAYDRFHQDRYGKDFWHVRVQSKGDASATTQRQTMTAALLSFWHQVASFRSAQAQKTATEQRLQVAAPLWILLGLSVIGSQKNEGDKQQTSDVVEVLAYLSTMLANPSTLAQSLEQLLATTTVGAELLPAEVRKATEGWQAGDLAVRILADCFAWQQGDKPVLRVLKSAAGELGLGLLRGDTSHYYGVVNVGDAIGLKKALEAAHLAVEDDAMSGSLFAELDAPHSGLQVLIGSRRFAEGWDNYRASSLTLLRLGQGEGSLIIQMFGRVVRFAGVGGNGKRLAQPPAELVPLQTAYVYGLQSRYLDAFLQSLGNNGVPMLRRIECNVRKHAPALLQSVRAFAPHPGDFRVSATGKDWLAGVNQVKVALTATVSTAMLKEGNATVRQGVVGEDITAEFRQWSVLLDLNAVYREMVEWRQMQRWWNFAFDMQAIQCALDSEKYNITGLPGMLAVRGPADLARLQRMATTVVRRLFESAYRKQENRMSRYGLVPSDEGGIPDTYFKEFEHVE
ncbi:DEAD/DEAH box helicase family protein [Candidatus Symbiobacter mobilis]|uniref:Helicase ATP-binding domain-containing protein n=1 Tax=Candidatus Symbiobacter mobilis CR TaxID=946483 RepID=U5NAG7_9BURK|nr:DEAD/DEAH box helicase family protein [Candidatus Symbiobacter mobilis]AGX88546.1 hypothetical protein Cenrod_2492 [Candidatus Symbiobacter mobilis CR]